MLGAGPARRGGRESGEAFLHLFIWAGRVFFFFTCFLQKG